MMAVYKMLKTASATLLTALLVGVLFCGCNRGERSSEPKPWEPASYMNDKKFTDKMKQMYAEQKELQKKHAEAKKIFDLAKANDPKLEKPETKQLKEKMDSLAKEYMDARKRQLKAVNERCSPKTEKKPVKQPTK